jgi:hypothetical protein
MNTFNTQAINRWLFVGTVALLAGFAGFFIHLPHARAACGTGCNNYYVNATTGDDTRSATTAQNPSTPWKTIGHAVSSFALGLSGTVIHVADGPYAESPGIGNGGSSSSVRLVVQCDNGTSNAIAAKGHCKVTGSSSAGTIFFVAGTANHVDIIGFDVSNANIKTGITVGSCGSGNSTCGNDTRIIGNYVHDIAQNYTDSAVGILGCPQSGAIQLGQGSPPINTGQQAIGNFILNYFQ